MKMKSVSSLFCAVAIFGTASVAMAGAYGEPEQAEEMPRPVPVVQEVAPVEEGFSPFGYIAAGGVYAEEFFDGNAGTTHNSYGWGYNLRGGYRFHPNVALEGLFEQVWFDGDRYKTTDPAARGKGSDRNLWQLLANAKVFFVEGFCEPYAAVGIGVMGAYDQKTFRQPSNGFQGTEDGYGFTSRFALGMDLYATENLFIEAEVAYNLPTGDASNYQYLGMGLGIGYAFN